MQLESHQLDRRWEHLRVREPHRQRRLLASLADSGQQTPIVVVVSQEGRERYLVIDGHKRVAALEQLGRDTVEATVWAMSEADALLLSMSLRSGPQESALEQGWLLAEMEQRFGYSLDELARRFDRSVSWVSRRLALVELLPEAIQQQVREGKLAAQVAMKYLVPVARVDADDCARMAAVFVAHGCGTRQAGQLYAAWRKGTRSPRAHSRRAGVVLENAAAAAGSPAGGGGTSRARSGDGDGYTCIRTATANNHRKTVPYPVAGRCFDYTPIHSSGKASFTACFTPSRLQTPFICPFPIFPA